MAMQLLSCHKESITKNYHLLKINSQGVGSSLKVTPKDIANMLNFENETNIRIERKTSKIVSLPPKPP